MLESSHPAIKLNYLDRVSRARWKKLLVAVWCLSVLIGSQVAASENAPHKTLRLVQKHYFFGTTELLIAKDAVRIENLANLRFIIVSKAPKWDVVVFRNDDKTFFSESLSKYEENGLVSDLLVTKRDRVIDGNKKPFNTTFKNIAVCKRLSGSQLIQYLPIKGLTSPQVEAIIYATYKLPTEHAIPLNMMETASGKDWLTGMDESGRRRIQLKTSECEFVTTNADRFEVPNGYRKIATIADAVSGSRGRRAGDAFGPMFDDGLKSK